MSDDDPRAGDGGPSEPPPLAPHLRDRPDRPLAAETVAHGRSQARLILLLLFVALPVVVLLVVVLNSLASGPPDSTSVQGPQGSRNEIARYCTYEVRSEGQFDDCLRRTDPRVVRRERTNAGRYARGELTRCLPDAGPRCTLR